MTTNKMALFRVDDIDVSSPCGFINYILKNGLNGMRDLLVTPPCGFSNEQTELVNVIRQGSLPALKSLLNKGAVDVNQADEQTGATPLIFASMCGHHEMVKRLLKKSANPVVCDKYNWNALHHSAWTMELKCIKILLSSSAVGQVNQKDCYGRTPLMIAAYKGNIDIVKMLIKTKADVFVKDNNGCTLIHWSMGSKNLVLLEMLNKYFPDMKYWNEQDNDGATPLHYAAVMGDVEAMSFLLAKGCDPLVDTIFEDCIVDGLAVIHWACVTSSFEQIKLLLNHNRDMLTLQSKGGLQPLHIAASTGNKPLCSLLIEEGANVCCSDSLGYLPLHWCSKYGHRDCLNFLLSNLDNNQIDALTNNNCTSLHLACKNGHFEIIEELLTKGAEIEKVSGDDHSCAIHLAANDGHIKVIEVLMSHNCPVDLLRESDGRTPLHVAANSGHTNCCQYLIEHGAQINIKDDTVDRLTALDIAMLKGHTTCVNYLLSQGAVTAGGKLHNSAIVIQRAWKNYVQKRRMEVNHEWAARRIQHHVHSLIDRKRSTRLSTTRERRRHNAASTIQRKWLEYIAVKKSMEESYHALKTKLNHQHMATQLILCELEKHTSNVHLPAPHNRVHMKNLLHSGIQPTPLFPSESLLFDNYPKTPLLKSVPHVPRVKAVQNKSTEVNKTSDGHFINRTVTVSLPVSQPVHTSIKSSTGSKMSLDLPQLPSSPYLVTNKTVSKTQTLQKKKRNIQKQNKISKKDEELLVNHAKRYDQLYKVMELLQQARDAHKSSNSTDSNYKELKTQIQSALEEAIRLRADTETLCKRMLPNK